MAVKSLPQTSSSGVDELLFQNDTVSLCLLVNRRNKTLRIIDFRAGPTPSKRDLVVATAKQQGVEKVFTLVERDEVHTWTRLGFVREGSIPGFYKRSDAWILGALVSQMARQPTHSSIRSAVDPDQTSDFDENPDDDETNLDDQLVTSPAVRLADRTIAHAKRLLKNAGDQRLPAVKLGAASELELKRAVAKAQRTERALTGFEPFGRDAERMGYMLTTRGGYNLYASWEMQACFGNSFLEILTSPRNESERLATTAAIATLCDKLMTEKVVSTFTFAPADDINLATVFLANGFRRSAVLARHLTAGTTRKDAILWSKKFGTPGGKPVHEASDLRL